MQIVFGILIVLAVILAAGVLTAVAVSRTRHSHQKHGSSGILSAGMLEIQSILEPSKRHVVIAEREDAESSDEDLSLGPDEAGVSSKHPSSR